MRKGSGQLRAHSSATTIVSMVRISTSMVTCARGRSRSASSFCASRTLVTLSRIKIKCREVSTISFCESSTPRMLVATSCSSWTLIASGNGTATAAVGSNSRALLRAVVGDENQARADGNQEGIGGGLQGSAAHRDNRRRPVQSGTPAWACNRRRTPLSDAAWRPPVPKAPWSRPGSRNPGGRARPASCGAAAACGPASSSAVGDVFQTACDRFCRSGTPELGRDGIHQAGGRP